MTYRNIKLVLAFVLFCCVCVFIYATRDWPFLGDAALIRYVNFLMQHGMAPYRDIADINMPGAYAVDWLVTHLFGTGPIAWRLFDLTLLGAATLAAVAIAWPCDWFAGVYCGALLLLVHGRDGVEQTGQRDLTIGVLELAAVALLFYARRNRSWPAVAAFGFFLGFASTIKPTVIPLEFILLLLLIVDLRRQCVRIAPYLIAGTTGFLLPLLLLFMFLHKEHALGAFLYTLRFLIPYHASIGRMPLSHLLLHMFSSSLLALVLLWIMTGLLTRNWQRWEIMVLLICLVFGLLSFVAQGKGYMYHRYPAEAFLLLLAGLEFSHAMQMQGSLRILGMAGLCLGVLVLAPVFTWRAATYQVRTFEFRTMLQGDLEKLGGERLSGHIQCLDTIGGCIDTLNKMQLVQSTGFLYDCYLFAPQRGPVEIAYRRAFWNALQKNPPEILVVTNQLCMDAPNSYDRLHWWPQLDDYLNANYTVVAKRTPPPKLSWWSHPIPPTSYRIYERTDILHK